MWLGQGDWYGTVFVLGNNTQFPYGNAFSHVAYGDDYTWSSEHQNNTLKCTE